MSWFYTAKNPGLAQDICREVPAQWWGGWWSSSTPATLATRCRSWWSCGWPWQSRQLQLQPRELLQFEMWLLRCVRDHGLLNSPKNHRMLRMPFLGRGTLTYEARMLLCITRAKYTRGPGDRISISTWIERDERWKAGCPLIVLSFERCIDPSKNCPNNLYWLLHTNCLNVKFATN